MWFFVFLLLLFLYYYISFYYQYSNLSFVISYIFLKIVVYVTVAIHLCKKESSG